MLKDVRKFASVDNLMVLISYCKFSLKKSGNSFGLYQRSVHTDVNVSSVKLFDSGQRGSVLTLTGRQ